MLEGQMARTQARRGATAAEEAERMHMLLVGARISAIAHD